MNRLTKTEKVVLGEIVNGLSNKEIAKKLENSSNTINVHRYNIMRKLNIHKTSLLVKYALENGGNNEPDKTN